MDFNIIICLLFFISIIVYIVCNQRKRNVKPPTPPGPWNFRLIGTLQMITWKDRFQIFSKLRTKYGNIFSVNFGNTRIVVLNDYGMVKEAFTDCVFSGKPVGSHWIDNGSSSNCGGPDSEDWLESRRFLIRSLHRLGFGTKSMESHFIEEAQDMIRDFRKTVGKVVHPHDRFRIASLNPVWNLAIGKKWKVDCPEFLKIKPFVVAVSKCCKIFLKGFAFPWLAKLYGNDYKTYLTNKAEIRNLLKKMIYTKKSEIDGSENLIELYTKKISETTDSKSCFYGVTGEATLLFALEDLLLGGSEAVSTALLWALLFLAKYPAVQENVFAEIQKTIQETQLVVTLADRQRMPYTEAFIMESMRFSGLNPLTHHKTVTDVDFRGYRILKGTTVVANFSEIFKDPSVWGDPQKFRPERFLSPDLTAVIQHEAFQMFSVGKRACPAKIFARDQIFIYVTHLCQQFKMQYEGTIKAHPGVFRYPDNPYLVFLDRKADNL